MKAPEQTEFKMNRRDSIWFHENAARVNIAYAKEVCDVAILPIGAIEQHGPHCPCGSDTFNAIGIAERVAENPAPWFCPARCMAPTPITTGACREPFL